MRIMSRPEFLDPLVWRVTIRQVAGPVRAFDLVIGDPALGRVVIAAESYAVVDQVREALHGHRAGVVGECLEVADAILARCCADCGLYGMTRGDCPRSLCGGPL